ncbi:MAG: bifunctional diaminohydroxyphosphoribosylaminopyrimidine deaminase/5-amino-6-(5-phosphoribosylamino)uracil reductase RibD [Alphaproteobacteria bacterium]|nr:bifunctional diaminohydroxyphosphoribosylaminopyrimidine deaminase/5-amino-6-(5-phosphoribosylamino)uracil reductase RibD [Alphaproteobacteria bacterium]
MSEDVFDIEFMRRALDLAQQGLGRVAPNPSVGCVIVKDGVIAGEARTADHGRPHAERRALEMAGDKALGATVYVTLEPCNNHGVTSPCVDELIEAGVARVVISCRDPFQTSEHSGGIQKFKDAGIIVDEGVLGNESNALNEGFFLFSQENRPFVSAKIASSLDGRIATKSGESKWITGSLSRQRGHIFRAMHDAVLCGIGTVLADDPSLTVRLDGHDGFQPVRIIIDRDLKIPLECKLVLSSKNHPVWIVCNEGAPSDKKKNLCDLGLILIELKPDLDGRFFALDVLQALAQKGMTRVLIEGGGDTISTFLREGMVDQLLWFRAPKIIGGDGVPALPILNVEGMDECLRLSLLESERLGDDILEIWKL